MKAEELRIGNSLNRKGLVVTIDATTIHNIAYYPQIANEYSPIPLTPEILERCGAIKLPRLMRNSIGILIDGETAIEYRMEPYIIRKLTLTISQENSDMQLQSIEKVLDIDYLHQLQNLYFVLTGTELTFKTGSAPTLH